MRADVGTSLVFCNSGVSCVQRAGLIFVRNVSLQSDIPSPVAVFQTAQGSLTSFIVLGDQASLSIWKANLLGQDRLLLTRPFYYPTMSG